jgi:hypothetical protein
MKEEHTLKLLISCGRIIVASLNIAQEMKA